MLPGVVPCSTGDQPPLPSSMSLHASPKAETWSLVLLNPGTKFFSDQRHWHLSQSGPTKYSQLNSIFRRALFNRRRLVRSYCCSPPNSDAPLEGGGVCLPPSLMSATGLIPHLLQQNSLEWLKIGRSVLVQLKLEPGELLPARPYLQAHLLFPAFSAGLKKGSHTHSHKPCLTYNLSLPQP